jgi:hypothetical protein
VISILFGGAVAMVLTLLGTRYAIKWLAVAAATARRSVTTG